MKLEFSVDGELEDMAEQPIKIEEDDEFSVVADNNAQVFNIVSKEPYGGLDSGTIRKDILKN